jgi:hypothetical protein
VEVADADVPWRSRFDDFELAARKLAGVVAVGFSGSESDLTVHLTLSNAADVTAARSDLPRLLSLYFDRPVSCALEIAGGGRIDELFHVALESQPEPDPEPIARSAPSTPVTPPRPAAGSLPSPIPELDEDTSGSSPRRVELVTVKLAGDGTGVEVRLSFGPQEETGRALGTGPKAAADATIAALRLLGWKTPFVVRSAIRLAVGVDGAIIVHLDGTGVDRIAISRARTPQEAAVKATLHALNRYLADPRHRAV